MIKTGIYSIVLSDKEDSSKETKRKMRNETLINKLLSKFYKNKQVWKFKLLKNYKESKLW